MSTIEVVVQGTLSPDGTLQLDQKPNLPSGRVTVVLQPAGSAAPPGRGLADVIDEIRQGQQGRGFAGRSTEAIEAQRKAEEDEYERKMRTLRCVIPD
jgi:hypothetical protein